MRLSAVGWTCLCAGLFLAACSDDGGHSPLPAANQYILAALNEAHTGDMGGLKGADALCASQAVAAGRKETYKAFLSNKYFSARNLVPEEAAEGIPVFNLRGELMAESWAMLMENGRWSSAYLYSFDGKRVDENSGAEPNWVDADGWHGSTAVGEVNPQATCRDWTSSDPTFEGAAGEWDSRRLLGQETHPCDLTLAVACVGALVLPTYGSCETPGMPCPATDPCAVEPICGTDRQCRASSLTVCQDELTCTEDTCDGQGGCQFKIKADACLIGGQCFQKGDPDPSSSCRACDPSQSQEQWSPLSTVCMSGTQCFQKGDLDPSKCNECQPGQGGDGWVPRTDDHCKIDGQCYSKGDKHPDGCAECDPAQSTISWTPSGNDCFIAGQCVAAGTKDGTGCNACDPTKSKTDWTPLTGTICQIDGKCYASGAKHPDGCAVCDPTVSGIAWTPSGNDCFIANKCYASGTKDPTGCKSCDPLTSKTAWTPIDSTKLCIINSQCYSKGDKHPQGCAECDPAASSTGWTVVTNDCLIDGQCYASGATKSVGCGKCDPALSKTSWSPLYGCYEIVLAALNEAHDGKLGGLAAADALCASQASKAGLSGTYKAFLSGTTRNVKDLVGTTAASYPVVNTKGEILYSSWSQMFTTTYWASGYFLYSFDGKPVDENTGASPDWYDAQAWHGSDTAGVYKAGSTCQDWTSNASSDSATTGEMDTRNLLAAGTQPCNQTLAVICAKVAP